MSLIFGFLDRARKRDILFHSGETPGETIARLESFFRDQYREHFFEDANPREHLHTTVLFAGDGEFAGGKEQFIYRLEVNEHFTSRPEPNFSLAGQGLHGGLYYIHKYRNQEMSLKQAAFLNYLCIREVSSLDGSVGGDVETILCKEGLAAPAPKEWGKEFALRHANAEMTMKSWFDFQ